MIRPKAGFARVARCLIAGFVLGQQGSPLAAAESNLSPLRPPAVPLVACDPYFSIWSPADKLTDADTVHWTGKLHRLRAAIELDGKVYRVMGKELHGAPDDRALRQTSCEVLPSRTIYTFEAEGVRMRLTFMTAALPEDLDVLSRPVTYLIWEMEATDGKPHDARGALTASPEIALNEFSQPFTIQCSNILGNTK